jgi:hypothetical protein
MGGQGKLKDEDTIAEFVLNDEEMMTILKALDLYGHSLMMSENAPELFKVKDIVIKIVTQLPRPDLNS